MNRRHLVLSLLASVSLVGASCSSSDGGGTVAHPQRATTTYPGVGPGLAGVGTLPPPASAWPAAGFDARHSSGTTAVGPQRAHVRWRRALEGDATPGPVIGVDGTVLAATNAGVLHDLDPRTGADVWTYDGGGGYGTDLTTSPAVLRDGTVLWPGPRNMLFALDRHGQLRWSERFAGQVLSPAVAGRDRVYVADLSGHLAAFELTGAAHRRVWTLDLHGTNYASPTVGPDGTVYVASEHDLVAVRDLGSRGAARWRLHTKQLVEVSNGVGPDGTVVLGTNRDLEFGVTPDGRAQWGFSIANNTYSSSLVRPDGTAYFGDNAGRLRVVDSRTGRVTASIKPIDQHEGIWASPAVDAHGDAYWATTKGHLYGYTKNGRPLFHLDLDAASHSSPALDAAGTLYIGTVAGSIYAVG